MGEAEGVGSHVGEGEGVGGHVGEGRVWAATTSSAPFSPFLT